MDSDPKEIGGYRVVARIGEGAASTLYAVQDPRTKQIWALKHVVKQTERDQRFIEQTETEYEVGSKLHHPAIRGIHKLLKHREKLFSVVGASLLMELVDGSTLDQVPAMADIEVVRIFREVADGLAHMHSQGFVHADLKPNNIILSHTGTVKVIDLGQGCRIGTVKKRIQGTPGYMAPEQAHRQAITPKTDIYNFGATLYWVLCRDVIPTALPPKDESSLFSGALDVEQVEPPIPPHVKNPRIHPMLSKLVLDCVKIDPEERPESMEAIHVRLDLVHDILTAPTNLQGMVADNEETTHW